MELTPLRRGVVRFVAATVARPDPLGIYRALRKQPLPQSLVVLPRRYPLPPIALPGGMKYQQGGVAMASNIGQSEEFVSLREYRRGDPPRHIHWRSWAKAGKPIVKEFEDEFFVRHALVHPVGRGGQNFVRQIGQVVGEHGIDAFGQPLEGQFRIFDEGNAPCVRLIDLADNCAMLLVDLHDCRRISQR